MNTPDLNFPNLGIKIAHLGRNIKLGSFTIAYYGIIIALAMFLGVSLIMYLAKKDGDNNEDYMDMALITLVVGVIGARIYYVIFRWNDYKDNLLQIFNLRAGGLAIYGGILVGAVSVITFTKIKKMNILKVMDNCIFGVVLGQAIGRWGNFFNCEAFGGYTNGLFAMQIKKSLVYAGNINASLAEAMQANPVIVDGVEYIQVHPTFLYESLWNLCVFGLLFVMRKFKRVDGMVIASYFILYGIGRFWIEGLRTDQLLITGTTIPVSQIVSIGLILVGIALIVWRNILAGKQPELLVANRKAAEALAGANTEQTLEGTSTEETQAEASAEETASKTTTKVEPSGKKSWRK